MLAIHTGESSRSEVMSEGNRVDSGKKQTSLWPLALIVLASLSYVFGAALSPDEVLYKRDHSVAFRGLLHEVVEALSNGYFPAWHPFRGGGEPLAAYPNAMAWSPLLAAFALPGTFDTLYDVFVILHFAVAGLGVAFLARQLRMAPVPCLMAGLLYAISGPLLSLNNLLPNLHTAVFGPWALGFCARLLVRKDLGSFLLASASIGLHAALTDPAYLTCSAFIFLGIFGPTAFAEKSSASARNGVRVLAAGLFGAALIALPALMTLDLLRDTPRGDGFRYSLLSHFSLRPMRMAEFIVPRLSGSSTVSWLADQFRVTGPRLYLDSVYLGVSALPLFVLGARLRRSRPWVLLWFLFLLLMLGHNTFVHELFVRSVPGLQMSRFPIKFSYGLAVCTSLLGGFALDALLRGEISERAQRVGAGVSLLVFGAAVFVVRVFGLGRLSPEVSPLPPDRVETLIELGLSHALLFGLLTALLLFLWTRIPTRWAVALLFALVGADLALQGQPFLPTAPLDLYTRPPIASSVLADETYPVVFLSDEHKLPPKIENPDEVDHIRYDGERLDPATAPLVGIQHLFDTDLSSNRSKEWGALHDVVMRAKAPTRLAILGRLGVSHLLIDTEADTLPGLLLVGRAPTTGGESVAAFRLLRRRSFAEWVPAARIASTWPEVLATLSSTTTSLDLAVIDERVESGAAGALTATSAFTRRALAVREARAGLIEVQVDAEAPGLVVVAQSYDRGWRALVDDTPTPVLRVEGLRVGVVVPAGASRLKLDYEPPLLKLGTGLSLAAGLVWLGLLILSLLRLLRTKPTASSPAESTKETTDSGSQARKSDA